MKFDRTFLRSRAVLLTLAGFLPLLPVHANAEDWVVRRATTSSSCVVILKTAEPKLGVIVGDKTFDSKKAACQHALANYDASMSESGKCWIFPKTTVELCAKEKVTLKK